MDNGIDVLDILLESFKYKMEEINNMQEKGAHNWQAIQDLYLNLQMRIGQLPTVANPKLKQFLDAWTASILNLANQENNNNHGRNVINRSFLNS